MIGLSPLKLLSIWVLVAQSALIEACRAGRQTLLRSFLHKFCCVTSSMAYLLLPPAVNADTFQSSEIQTINLFEQAKQSVVYISTFVEGNDGFSMNEVSIPAGTGSGK